MLETSLIPSPDRRLAALPHRPPFIFIDEILEVANGESAHCIKTFSPDDPLFQGHFPGDPIVPGVLLTEALAQASGIAAAAGRPGEGFLLSAVRQMKFPAAARPGERIGLYVKKSGEMGPLLVFDGTASTQVGTVAEGRVVLNRRKPN